MSAVTNRQALRAAIAGAAALLGSGCAYYNAGYNASKWARQAERSERAGRTAEARDRWQRAALHAESLLARHPNSRWADDALLVRGRALVRLERWSEAAGTLRRAVVVAETREQRLDALALLGEALLGLRLYDDARQALDSFLQDGGARVRARALLLRGRVLLAQGDPAAALADFRQSGMPEARLERVRSALALNDPSLVLMLADTLLGTAQADPAAWLPLLDSLARAVGSPESASRFVSQLAARRDIGRGDRARLLLADGDRLLAAGERDDLARGRYLAVAALVPDSGEARLAAVRLVRLDLRGAERDSVLAAARERLEDLQRQGGAAGREAQALLRLVQRVDTLRSAGDVAMFLAAELLRDSLEALRLAPRAFESMAERHATSPWAPKALLAAIVGGHPRSDSLVRVLEERYGESPYAAIALGRAADEARFAALEDSLERALDAVNALDAGRELRRPTAGPEDDRPARSRPSARPAPVVRPVPGARPRVEP